MTHFNRYPTTQTAQMDRLSIAYRAAGVTEPNRALRIAELVAETPTTHQVTDRLAKAALLADDADKFYADALAQIRDAQAADAFRETFKARLIEHGQRNMGDMLEAAVTDLTPAFDKLVKHFTSAAAKLPAAQPLDMGANVENDTAAEYKTVRDGLATIAQYASIYVAMPPGDLPTDLARLLPVVALPEAEQELITGLARTTVNPDRIPGTTAIRDLARAARDDLDLALIGVARGEFPGCILNLGTPTDLRDRAATILVANSRRLVEDNNAVRVLR